VLAYISAAEIYVSPCTREGFGIPYAEAMAAGCTGIGADHPDEGTGDAGFHVKPTVDDLTQTLEHYVGGKHPPRNLVERARQYDWDAVADQAEQAYHAALDGSWYGLDLTGTIPTKNK
jgi:glycosyltransferase involved in cell wall biosynthesis